MYNIPKKCRKVKENVQLFYCTILLPGAPPARKLLNFKDLKTLKAKKLFTKLVASVQVKLKLFFLVASLLNIEESKTGKGKLLVKLIEIESLENEFGVWREELRE